MLLKALLCLVVLTFVASDDGYFSPRYPCDSIEKCEQHGGFYQTVDVGEMKQCCASDMHLPHLRHDENGETRCECIVKYIG